MRVTKVVASVALLGAAGAGTLRADFRDFSNICIVGALRSCASIQVFTTIVGTTTQVTMRVKNLQGTPIWGNLVDNTGGSLITRIGIVAPQTGTATGLTVGTVGSVNVVGTNPGNAWMLRNPGGLNTPIEMDATLFPGTYFGAIKGCSSAAVTPSAYFETCGAGAGWVEFKFTTSQAWSANNAVVGFLSQQWTAGGGHECDTQGTTPGRALCEAIVPEPVTMLLLGTGLAGVGGVGLVRRRRGHDVNNT